MAMDISTKEKLKPLGIKGQTYGGIIKPGENRQIALFFYKSKK